MLEVLNSERFVDKAPAEVYATLLDEETYLCSISTMYRLLRAAKCVRERRNQLRHPNYSKPELLATRPNQLWSWDITKLRGPKPWSYYYLYVILDVYSRYVVGWMVAERESALLAKRLLAETMAKQGIEPGELTVHADRGSSMRSKLVAQLLADLGVTKTHSRPHTSNDNPFSESQFKTMKYRPDFPARFGSLVDARSFGRSFFPWVQSRPSPPRARAAHACGRARRPGRRGARAAAARPGCGLCGEPRAIRQAASRCPPCRPRSGSTPPTLLCSHRGVGRRGAGLDRAHPAHDEPPEVGVTEDSRLS